MGVPHNDIQEMFLEESRSLSSDFDSFAQEILYFDRGSVQFIWSGANSATAEIIPQASNDGVNWCDLASGTNIQKITVGSGCRMYNLPDLNYKWFRVSFSANSNTAGTASILTIMKRGRHVV